MESPKIEMVPVAALRPYPGNARRHSKKQVRQIADSITRFGFTNPVLVSDHHEIIAGHGRLMAAKELGLATVPTVRLSHLSAEERRAYVLADNKLALNAGWDTEILAIELQALVDLEFDVTLTGLSLAEVDLTLDQAREASATAPDSPADRIPLLPSVAVSQPGDLWLLGRHRLMCGNAMVPEHVASLLGSEKADLIFTDPPYNVRIDGNVCGLGSVRHREFAFASGEMTREQFTGFLTTTLTNAATAAKDGAVAFVCMDWRHIRELLEAGEEAFSELKNLCVWNKRNGGMGSFYRSKHELVFVFKVGTAPHTNSFGLGETGRYRTNVWDYAGISSLGADRMDELIDYEKGVTIIGPLNERELAQLQETMRVRDVLIMQDALDRRQWDTKDTGDSRDGPGTAILFALLINQRLPQRYKLSDTQIEMRMMCHDTLSKRELLKQLYRAWQAIGAAAHRGKTFPPLRFAKQLIEQLGDYLTQPLAMRDA